MGKKHDINETVSSIDSGEVPLDCDEGRISIQEQNLRTIKALDLPFKQSLITYQTDTAVYETQ
jgi:hypothetical protein